MVTKTIIKTTKFRAKRRHGRKRARQNPLKTRAGEAFARKVINKIKYDEVVAYGGVVPDYIFNMNSLFDPNHSGGGHQPYGRDVLALLYNRYRVFGFKYNIKFTCAPSLGPFQVVVFWTEDNNAVTNVGLANEIPGSQNRLISGGSSATISGKISLPRATGQTSEQYMASDKYHAQNGASPTEVMCLHVLAFDMAGNATTGVSFNARLEYLSEWFDPITLGQS